jgi:hypothetical protein
MVEIGNIPFTDAESNGEGIVIIRAKTGCVGLCLSSFQNGDIEVFLAPEKVEQIIAALKEAVLAARTGEAK